MNQEDLKLWRTIREALLLVLDGIERRLKMSPRTAELRKIARK